MLVLSSVIEDAKFGRAQLGYRTFTDRVLLPDVTANDGWSIVLQYLAFVHAGKARHLIFSLCCRDCVVIVHVATPVV